MNLLNELPGLAYRCRNDSDWTMLFVSAGAEALTGYRPEQLLGNRDVSYGDLIHPGDREAVWESVQAAIASREPFQLTYRITRASGETIWVWEQGRAVFDGAGRILHLQGIITDVSEQRRQQEALRKLSRVVEQSQEIVIIADPRGVIEYVNPAFERATGYSRAEALGKTPRMLKSGVHDRAFYRAMWRAVLSGETWQGTIVNRRKDGELFYQDTILSALVDDAGAVTNLVGVSRDVTEQRELETQLQASQRLESVGRLAGGVAHDFNNLLTAISGFTDLLAQEIDPDSQQGHDLLQVRLAADRAALLTRKLLAFSKGQKLERRVVDLGQIVREIVTLLRRTIRSDVDIQVQLPESPAWTLADPIQLDQVLANLVINAREAMSGKGRIVIGVRQENVIENGPRGRHQIPSGEYVVLSVADDGVGIPPENLGRVLEPFFTTKETGTGLGLATTYGIVQQHDGHLFVDSPPGEGTQVSIYLPRAAPTGAPAPARAPVERSAALLGHGNQVVVVDDDIGVRATVCRILESQGFTVREFGDPNQVLRALGGETDRIRLFLLDLVMPGIGGVELFERIRQTHPGLPVVFMTGHVDAGILERLPEGVAIVHKPFDRAKLLDSVWRAVLPEQATFD